MTAIKWVYLILSSIALIAGFYTDSSMEWFILGHILITGYFLIDKLDDIHADVLKARSKR